MAIWDDKGNLISVTKEEAEQIEKYGVYPEPPAKKAATGFSSVLKYPIGKEPPPPADEPVSSIGREKESLLLRSYSATLSTDGDLKSLSQVLSQKAKKPVSQSAIIRALVHLAAHDSALIPKILSYVLHEDIIWGRK